MVQINKGDLVRIEYTGKLSSNGQIFDTTSEQVAREVGILQPGVSYGPKLAAFGTNTIMMGLEEAIASSQLGKPAEFAIPPAKAFGEKKPELVRMLSAKEFARQNLRPMPGMVLTLDGIAARVKSVESGRVVVDLNHPLAGEQVSYLLTVSDVITGPKEKIEALLATLGVQGTVSQNNGGFVVSISKDVAERRVLAVRGAIETIVPGTTFKVE